MAGFPLWAVPLLAQKLAGMLPNHFRRASSPSQPKRRKTRQILHNRQKRKPTHDRWSCLAPCRPTQKEKKKRRHSLLTPPTNLIFRFLSFKQQPAPCQRQSQRKSQPLPAPAAPRFTHLVLCVCVCVCGFCVLVLCVCVCVCVCVCAFFVGRCCPSTNKYMSLTVGHFFSVCAPRVADGDGP